MTTEEENLVLMAMNYELFMELVKRLPREEAEVTGFACSIVMVKLGERLNIPHDKLMLYMAEERAKMTEEKIADSHAEFVARMTIFKAKEGLQ